MSTAPMGPAELADKAGQEIGVSSWIEVGQQRIDDTGDAVVELVARHHLADQADGQGALGADPLGALEVAQGMARPDGAQHVGADHRRDDAELDLGGGEHRLGRGDGNVAGR